MSTITLTIQSDRGKVAVPITITPAPTTPVAQFSRVLYARGGAATASRYAAMALESVPGQVAQIKAANPACKLFVYQDGIWSNPDPTQGIPADPTWTAKDANGQPITYQGGPVSAGRFLVQPDHPAFQQAWLKHAIAQSRLQAFDGTMLDDISAIYPGHVPCPQYAGKAWQAAVLKGLGVQVAGLHAAGLLAWANIGGAVSAAPDPFWVAAAGISDWATEESWINAGLGLAQQDPYFKANLANVAWSEAHGKGVMVRCDDASAAVNEFGLACMLLVAGGHATYATSNTSYAGQELWFPAYDTALQLGAPLDPPQLAPQSSGLYVRRFQNGVVTVNPAGAVVAGMAANTGTIL